VTSVRVVSRWLAWLVPVALTGCGSGVIEGREPTLVDDVEDGDDAIIPQAGRQGSWFAFASNQTGDDKVEVDLVVRDDRPGSTFSAHFAETVEEYGGLGVSLAEVSYDASRYSGVTFWARRSEGSLGTFYVAFPNIDTHDKIGTCRTADPPKKCNDHWACRVQIGTEWQRFAVLFDELAQAGWDDFYHVDAFQRAGLKDITLNVRGGTGVQVSFELWLDDIAFIREGDESAALNSTSTAGRCR